MLKKILLKRLFLSFPLRKKSVKIFKESTVKRYLAETRYGIRYIMSIKKKNVNPRDVSLRGTFIKRKLMVQLCWE